MYVKFVSVYIYTSECFPPNLFCFCFCFPYRKSQPRTQKGRGEITFLPSGVFKVQSKGQLQSFFVTLLGGHCFPDLRHILVETSLAWHFWDRAWLQASSFHPAAGRSLSSWWRRWPPKGCASGVEVHLKFLQGMVFSLLASWGLVWQIPSFIPSVKMQAHPTE